MSRKQEAISRKESVSNYCIIQLTLVLFHIRRNNSKTARALFIQKRLAVQYERSLIDVKPECVGDRAAVSDNCRGSRAPDAKS